MASSSAGSYRHLNTSDILACPSSPLFLRLHCRSFITLLALLALLAVLLLLLIGVIVLVCGPPSRGAGGFTARWVV